MTRATWIERWQSYNILFLTVTVGLAVWFASSGVSEARAKKDLIYNECACACVLPGQSFGTITDIKNTAGLPCGAYNNKTCNVEDPETGGIRSGTTKECGPFKPSGTKGMVPPPIGTNPPVLQRRGVEGERPDTTTANPSGTSPESK